MTFSKQTGFNKTFCICHRKGATKPGKVLTLFLWQASKALQTATGTIAWNASESSSYLLLCTVSLFTDFRFLGLCHHSEIFLSFTSITFSHLSLFFFPESPLVCCQSHPRWSEMNMYLWCLCSNNNNKHSFTPHRKPSIYPDLDVAVIARVMVNQKHITHYERKIN